MENENGTIGRNFEQVGRDRQMEDPEQPFLPPWLSRTVLFCSSYSEWLPKGG